MVISTNTTTDSIAKISDTQAAIDLGYCLMAKAEIRTGTANIHHENTHLSAMKATANRMIHINITMPMEIKADLRAVLLTTSPL